MYLGIDIAGAFTDLVLMDDEGGIGTAKALTTPGELETGAIRQIEPKSRMPAIGKHRYDLADSLRARHTPPTAPR